MKQLIKILGIRHLENQPFQLFCIVNSIFYSLTDSLNMEKLLKIIQIIHEELPQVFCIIPFLEQCCQLIIGLVHISHSPKMIFTIYNTFELHFGGKFTNNF